MKVRYGFVTNSSSSSFIVAFNNTDEMSKIAFEYRERIVNDIMNPKNQISVEKALDYFESGCYCSIYYNIKEAIREEKEFGYDKYAEWLKWEKEHESEIEEKVQMEMNKQKEELRKEIEGKKILSIISYSDDESEEEAILEQYCYDMECCYAALNFH